jgi:ubiquinone/menaquinone biosynthesis C-methylase UbiE
VYHPDGPTFLELMRQALTSTERGYDLIAPKFDHTPFRTPDAVLEAMIRAIRDDSAKEAAPLRAALDVCCGTGAAMSHLRALCKERVVGLDFSQGMLDEARRRVNEAPGDARVELVRGDALELPFDAELDVVTCVGAFGHILPADEDRFVAGIARALRPGGRFVFATGEMPPVASQTWWILRSFNAIMRVRNALIRPQFIMYYLTFLWPEVRARLEKHGFRVEGRRGLCPAPYDRAIIVIATKD